MTATENLSTFEAVPDAQPSSLLSSWPSWPLSGSEAFVADKLESELPERALTDPGSLDTFMEVGNAQEGLLPTLEDMAADQALAFSEGPVASHNTVLADLVPASSPRISLASTKPMLHADADDHLPKHDSLGQICGSLSHSSVSSYTAASWQPPTPHSMHQPVSPFRTSAALPIVQEHPDPHQATLSDPSPQPGSQFNISSELDMQLTNISSKIRGLQDNIRVFQGQATQAEHEGFVLRNQLQDTRNNMQQGLQAVTNLERLTSRLIQMQQDMSAQSDMPPCSQARTCTEMSKCIETIRTFIWKFLSTDV